MRKLYRLHADLQAAFPNPYQMTPLGSSFLDWLKDNRRQLGAVVIGPRRLQQAFDELFDQSYYLTVYPDAAESVAAGQYASALDHYIQVGSTLFYDPNEFFVSRYYFSKISDRDRHLLRSRTPEIENTLLWHYLVSGLPNGHEPIEYFDSGWYIRKYPDVAQAFSNGLIATPMRHFLVWGSNEDRQPGPEFTLLGNTAAGDLPRPRGGLFGQFVRRGGVAGRLGVILDG